MLKQHLFDELNVAMEGIGYRYEQATDGSFIRIDLEEDSPDRRIFRKVKDIDAAIDDMQEALVAAGDEELGDDEEDTEGLEPLLSTDLIQIEIAVKIVNIEGDGETHFIVVYENDDKAHGAAEIKLYMEDEASGELVNGDCEGEFDND